MATSADVAASAGGATANSPLFTKLMPELRQLILKAAFGGRKLHFHRSPGEEKRFGGRVCCVWNNEPEGSLNPIEDGCLQHTTYEAIGAMGWLLCCRQALVCSFTPSHSYTRK